MKYQAYKGRKIDFSQNVEIYKNLHKGLFSIRQNGKVVAHVASFSMIKPSFKVNEKARLKVIESGVKNVHAFIIGKLIEIDCTDNDLIISNPHTRIRYNPYHFSSFVIGVNSAPIYRAEKIYGCCKLGLVML